MKWYQLDKKYTIDYLLLSLLGFFYVFPIILISNNSYFNDDLGWSLGKGGIGFKGDGRPLLEYLSLALCGGEPATDTAPLPLILGILFLCYALILYAKENLGFISSRCALLSVLLFIITNPLFAEYASYRYGSMGVFASLGLPFIIFSIPETVSRIKIFVYSAFLTMAFMSLQQSAIGMCLILFMVTIFSLLFQGKKVNYVHEGLRIIGIGAGAIVYKAVIANHYVSRYDWRYGASQTLELSPKSILVIFSNIADTCKFIMRFISETALWYQIVLASLVILTILLSVLLYCRDSKKQGWRKAVDISFLILSPPCVFILSFLALMILQEQTLKVRIFTTLGGFLLYLGILLLHFAGKRQTLIRPLLLLFILCNLYHYTHIYSYANAMNSQAEYAKHILYDVVHDLETINADQEFTRFSFIGEAPKARRTQIFSEKYPMASALIPRYFTNDSWRGGAYVLQYLQYDLTLEADTDADREIVGSEEPVLANSLYSCYLNDDKIIIAFHENE